MLATSASKAGAPVMRHARSTRACQVSRPGIAPRLRQSTPPRHQSCRPTAAASGGSLPQHPAAAPARAEDTAWPAELPLDFERKREGYLVELRRAAAFAALGLGSLCSCVWLLFQALDAVMKGLSWSQAAAAALAPKFERLLSLFVGRAEATAMAPGLAAALTPSILQLFAVIFVLFMLTLYLAINGIVTAELISKHLNFRLLKVGCCTACGCMMGRWHVRCWHRHRLVPPNNCYLPAAVAVAAAAGSIAGISPRLWPLLMRRPPLHPTATVIEQFTVLQALCQPAAC